MRSHSESSATFELALLGPLEARLAGEPLELGGARPRSLLAFLALNLGTAVSTDRIVEELWGEESPPSARHMVAVYTSRLRKEVGDGVVVTRRAGYELGLEPEQVDAVRFERLLAEGREALAVGNPDSAAAALVAGLALWKGPALADFAYEPFAQTDIARLEELRLQAEEERFEAELALGQGDALVAELEGLVAAAPLRERRRAQHMLALYRAGRQADALAAYQDARRTLVDELGIEPGSELRELERRILAQDEELLVGAPPAVAAPRPDSRRTVTVVVAELLDPPTELEDPELSRSLTRAGLEHVRAAAARYGGTADELPDGDLLAVFGSPLAHEDDCIRALRALGDLRAQRIVSRAGVDTGEILAEADDSVRGPVVRTAARLKASAAPGDVIVSESIGQLVAEVARLEQVDSDERTSFRLLDLALDAPQRPLRLDVPLIGRHRELAELRDLFARAVEEQRAQLVTVVGEPGIGKSRLAHELGELLVDEALVLRGRCLAYGEGMTYWPLREIVSTAVGSLDQARLADVLTGEESADAIAGRIASVVGSSDAAHPVEEIRWAVTRLLARLSRERPLVVVVDDAHWAEPTFMDLIEHVAGWDGRAPILMLRLVRPEFFEKGARRSTDTIVLEALSPDESKELLELLTTAAAQPAIGDQIVDAASGNPLFLEQLAAFTADRGSADRRGVPPASLQSLLAARLDALGPGERAAVESASVLGREFSLAPLTELLPLRARPALERHLEALTRKRLIEGDLSPEPFEPAFRFRHILIQEAAYRSLPLARRAELHERVADWAERREHVLSPDEDQVVGYHLEQAHTYRSSLGAPEDELRALGRRAGERLAAAGRLALGRDDDPAAVGLLERAIALLPEPRARLPLSVLLGVALESAGRYERAYSLLEGTIEEARTVGDVRSEWLATVQLAPLGTRVDPRSWSDERLDEIASSARRVFEAQEDDLGLARSWMLAVESSFGRCRFDDAAVACRRVLEHSERAGDEREILSAHEWLCAALYFGSTHVDDVRAEAEVFLERAGERPGKAAAAVIVCAGVDALRGDAAGAMRHYMRAKSLAEEAGLARVRASITLISEEVGMLFDDASFTERELRVGSEMLEEGGEKGVRSTITALLARALFELGRWDEAERLVDDAIALAAPADVLTHATARAVRARLLGVRGEIDEAERLAREAFELVTRTDALFERATVSRSFAEVLILARRHEEAKDALREAVELSERKGDVMTARLARARLAEL
jgi:DNA-binding SARP family transcriptional activator